MDTPVDSGDVHALLSHVLSSVDEHGTLFGGYVLHEKLGSGGFGVVYRASRVGGPEAGESDFVALKQMRGGSQATAAERREFLAGAETMASLDHPGIVRVRDFGESDKCPFFTMDLVEGRDLSATLEAGRPSQAQAAGWLAQMARAIDSAHERGVLHCDLKPANVLVDKAGSAFVTDFGSARYLGSKGNCDESGSGVISYYMSPEQARRGTCGLTRRADLYSLGVLFYELLTESVPYQELAFAHWVSTLAADEPVPSPRDFDPKISRDLEQICLKCLEKDPSQRYASAALLADDLESVLRGERIRRPSPWLRARRWLRRHPLLSSLFAAALLLGLVLTVALLSLWQADREQQQAALETNAFIANSQAGALLFELRDLADRIERCTQRAPIVAFLTRKELSLDTAPAEPCTRGFHDVSLFDTEGRLLAHWPLPLKPIIGKNFAFRAYFRGAKRLAERGLPGAFLSGAYRSESIEQLQFSLAAPVRAANGEWLGVAVGSLTVASAIGNVRMHDSSGGGHLVALLGPRDGDRTGRQGPHLDFVIHPHLDLGREVAVGDPDHAILRLAPPAPPGEQFALHWSAPLLLSEYHDPLLPSQQGSLTAFAPVGHTGYVVAIETSKGAVLTNGRALVKKLAWRAGVPFALGLIAIGGAALGSARRKRRLEQRPESRANLTRSA